MVYFCVDFLETKELFEKAAAFSRMALYIPSNSEQQARDFTPSTLAVVGHELVGNADVLHWCIYFQSESRSVRIDMSVGADGITGILIISNNETLVSDRERKTIYFPIPTEGTKVGSFLDVIFGNGYERYKFTEQGFGCRHWVKIVLRAFIDADLAQGDNFDLVTSAMQKVWPNGTNALMIEEGTFF